ncbi:MAG TPA: hypothetical protein VKB51_02255 [bacterium]|nr:hypothetical protein [bacterium]
MIQPSGRRAFLRNAGAGVLALGAAPWLAGCGGVVRDDLADPSVARPRGVSTQEAEWLGLAALAPSGHNAQPWTVRIVQPGRWVIGSSRERWLPAVDPDNRELLLSVGAFVENLSLAVGTKGYRLQVAPLTDESHAADLLDVRLTPIEPVNYPLERMRQRCTVRAALPSRPLRAKDWEALRAHAPEQVFYYQVGSRQAELVRTATLEANRGQAARDDSVRELAAWIRWRDTAARTLRNGLTPEAMGIHGLTGWYVRHFYTPADVLTADFRRRTLERVTEQLDHNGGWIAVTSTGPRLADVVAAGRVFERLALEALALGIAVHPMSQALEESPWSEHMSDELGLSEAVQFLLRVGYVEDYPRPMSLRMPLVRFVTV